MMWRNEYSREWRRRFALFPTSLFDGRTVWLCRFMERYIPVEPADKCPHCHTVGRWERKLPSEIIR